MPQPSATTPPACILDSGVRILADSELIPLIHQPVTNLNVEQLYK